MSERDGIWIPVSLATALTIAAAVICSDMIADVATDIQEGESVVDIIRRGLAAMGWGLMTWYMADKLWQWRKRRKYRKEQLAEKEHLHNKDEKE